MPKVDNEAYWRAYWEAKQVRAERVRQALRASRGKPVLCASPADHEAMRAAIKATGRKRDQSPILAYSDMVEEEGWDHLAAAMRQGAANLGKKSPFYSSTPTWSAYGKHKSGITAPTIYMHHSWDGMRPSWTATVSFYVGGKKMSYDTTDPGHLKGLIGELEPFHDREGYYGSRQSLDRARRHLGMPPTQPNESA